MRARTTCAPTAGSCRSRSARSSSAKGRGGAPARASRRRVQRGSRVDEGRGPTGRRSSDRWRAVSVSSNASGLDHVASRASPDLAVDDRADDDEQALEDVLPLLVEPEEHRGVEHLHAEAGAHQCADEGTTAAEEARPAEHDRGDRGERVTGALARVTNAELRKQDDSSEQRQERGTEIADQHGAIERDTDAACRLLTRADSAQAEAELR